MSEYTSLIETIKSETNCVSDTDDAVLREYAQELAEGVTAERDAEIAANLPVPYTKRVNARAQIDGDTLLIPRAVTATAARAEGEDWITSTRGPKMANPKAMCAVGVHEEFVLPGVVEIIRVVILWRRDK